MVEEAKTHNWKTPMQNSGGNQDQESEDSYETEGYRKPRPTFSHVTPNWTDYHLHGQMKVSLVVIWVALALNGLKHLAFKLYFFHTCVCMFLCLSEFKRKFKVSFHKSNRDRQTEPFQF